MSSASCDWHALLLCQDNRVCELRKDIHFLFEDFLGLAARPYLPHQDNNLLALRFALAKTNSVFLLQTYLHWCWPRPVSSQSAKQPGRRSPPHCNPCGFICGWPRPVSSWSAKQPGWRSSPIVTIATKVRVCCCTVIDMQQIVTLTRQLHLWITAKVTLG